MINSDLQKAIAACTEKTVEETVNEEDDVEDFQTPTGTETPSVPDAKQDSLWEAIPPAELLPPDDVPLTLTAPVTSATERAESLVEEESRPESGPISGLLQPLSPTAVIIRSLKEIFLTQKKSEAFPADTLRILKRQHPLNARVGNSCRSSSTESL